MRPLLYISLGCLFLFPLEGWTDSGRVDSLRRAFNDPAAVPVERVDLAFKLAEQFRNNNHLDSAMNYSQKGIALSEQVGENRRIQFYDQAGQLHFKSKKYLMAIRYFHKGEMMARESDDPVKLARLRNSLGIVHGQFGANEQAIAFFQQALSVFLEQGMKKQALATQKNLARLYQKTGREEIAEPLMNQIYEDALANGYERIGCKTRLLQTRYFNQLGQRDKAEHFLTDAFELAHRYDFIEELGIYLLWAQLKAEQGQHAAAMDSLKKAWPLVRKDKDNALIYQQKGDLHEMAGQYDWAMNSYKRAYELMDSLFYKERKQIAERMADLHRKKGDLLQADSMAQVADSIGKVMYEQERKYRLEELDKSADFDAHLERAAYKDSKASEEKMVHWLIVVLGLGLLSAIIWSYYLSNGRTFFNQELRRRYDEVQGQHQEIQEKYESLSQVNLQLESVVAMISHDIKGPLRTILAHLHFISKAEEKQEQASFLKKIKATTLRINDVVSSAMVLVQIGKSNLPMESFELRPMLEEIVADLEGLINESGGKVILHDLPTLLGHPKEVRHIFLNLISNGLKFARPGIPPIVEVSSEVSDTSWRVFVKDNGIGFNPDHLAEALKPSRRIHEEPDLYPGTGMGLTVCKQVADWHGWELGVEAVEGGGAGFWVRAQKKQEA